MAGRPKWRVTRGLKRVLEALAQGHSREAACSKGDVSRATFYARLQTDQTFATRVLEAEDAGKAAAEAVVLAAFDADNPDVAAKWAAWMLERKYRQEYGQQIDIRQLPTEALLALLGIDTTPQAPMTIQEARRRRALMLAQSDSQEPVDAAHSAEEKD